MIAVTEHAQGAVLPIRAKAGARANEILDEHKGALRVAVSAAPEHGKANQAIIDLLADNLNLRRSQIELIAGATSRDKKFLVASISPAELLARIAGVIEPTVIDFTGDVPKA